MVVRLPPPTYACAVPPTRESDTKPVAPTVPLAPTPIRKAQALPPVSALMRAEPLSMAEVALLLVYLKKKQLADAAGGIN